MDLNKDKDTFKIIALNGIIDEDSKKASLDVIVIPQEANNVNDNDVGQNNENNLTLNLEGYYKIITRYRNGEFGDEHLSLAEILDAAGEKDLLKRMSISEIQYLIDNSSGITKMMFLEVKKQKTNGEDHIEEKQLTLVKKRKN